MTQYIPNPPELVLLKTLWATGPLPVRALHDECAGALAWSFSSTRKTLSRMVDKNLVSINRDTGVAVYAARRSKTATLAHMARDFMHRVLETDGSVPHNLFSRSKLLSDEELEELEGLF
jgi:predicted transcriptional regulator